MLLPRALLCDCCLCHHAIMPPASSRKRGIPPYRLDAVSAERRLLRSTVKFCDATLYAESHHIAGFGDVPSGINARGDFLFDLLDSRVLPRPQVSDAAVACSHIRRKSIGAESHLSHFNKIQQFFEAKHTSHSFYVSTSSIQLERSASKQIHI